MTSILEHWSINSRSLALSIPASLSVCCLLCLLHLIVIHTFARVYTLFCFVYILFLSVFAASIVCFILSIHCFVCLRCVYTLFYFVYTLFYLSSPTLYTTLFCLYTVLSVFAASIHCFVSLRLVCTLFCLSLRTPSSLSVHCLLSPPSCQWYIHTINLFFLMCTFILISHDVENLIIWM